jgi:16S rRNA (guanine527-N7)-methyltransferase
VLEVAQSAYALAGVHLSPSQIRALEQYEKELLRWNERFNLTAIRNVDQVRIKHFLDSLTCLIAMRDSPVERVVDVGTGAGFPGLPLKIALPEMGLTLVESVGKKAAFCQHIVRLLGLENVEIIQERAELLGQTPAHRQRYDWAIARAVAIMPVLVEYLLPLVRIGGTMLAMKGETAPAETHAADRAMRMLGGQLRRLIPIQLPCVAEEHYLVLIDKIAATPDIYPRRVGMPAKHPLSS